MDTQLVEEIELEIEQAQEIIALGQALRRLEKNADFLLLIKESYLRDESVRLVNIKAHPQMQTPDMQARVLRDIDGIGSLAQYFNKVLQQAEMATHGVEQAEAALAEMNEEEGNDQ